MRCVTVARGPCKALGHAVYLELGVREVSVLVWETWSLEVTVITPELAARQV